MKLSRAAIEQRIAEFDQMPGWYQDIDLGAGIHTKSRVIWGEAIDHPRERWEMIEQSVPTDLSGMSVLDIGCNAGYLAFEAHERGADYVLGIDTNSLYIDQARFCAQVKRAKVRFEQRDVYDLDSLAQTFDLVFFVGVLYHCRNFQLAVERVAGVTAGTLIVESAIDPSETDVPYVRFVRSSQYRGPKSEGDARLPGHWHPNMAALEAVFREEGFSQISRIAKNGGRGAIVARR